MNAHRIILPFLLLQLVSDLCFAQVRFADVGPEALYQRSLQAQSRLTVLSVSLQPGYEDLGTLGLFRLGKGAQVMSAFVTNGEAGESDIQGEYPLHLAATRRLEATQAASYIGAEAYFLNLPDIGAAPDTASVRLVWDRDTLQARLMRLISTFRPDIILLSRDWPYGSTSARWQVLRSDLMKAVARWPVERVWIDEGSGKGVRVPVDATYPISGKSYRAIGEQAAECYASLKEQRGLWREEQRDSRGVERTIAYRLAFPRSSKLPKSLDAGLPRAVPPRLSWIERGLAGLTGATMKGAKTLHSAPGRPESALTRLAVLMDSLDLAIASSGTFDARERRILLNWKVGLEELRCSLLGVQVHYTLSDSILTDRQVTFLKIDTITGLPPGGRTEVFFPFVDRGWAVNESAQKRMPIDFGQPYRLLSPLHVEYNFPFTEYGLLQSRIWHPLLFFIVHTGVKREENFVDRIAPRLLFTPRFTVEVLTPIVRAVPSERLVVRLTNHSRDGVRDTVRVRDSLVVSTESEFRLNAKDQSHLDTLFLTWKRALEEGTYLLPIQIGEDGVANFAVREFDAGVDSSRRVALITGIENSPLEGALRRLQLRWSRIDLQKGISESLASCQVLLIDRRAMTLVKKLKDYRSAFDSFVERGGHLVVMSQDASIWNESPLVEGTRLTTSPAFDENQSVEIDSTSRYATNPNRLRDDAWIGWLYRRAHNILSGEALDRAEVVVRSSPENDPLIATWRRGRGTITYCDLALEPQLLNIHPGAFRLLANLLSN